MPFFCPKLGAPSEIRRKTMFYTKKTPIRLTYDSRAVQQLNVKSNQTPSREQDGPDVVRGLGQNNFFILPSYFPSSLNLFENRMPHVMKKKKLVDIRNL